MKLRNATLLLPFLLAGCVDDSPTDTGFDTRLFSILGGLEVGQTLTLSGEEARKVFLNGGPEGHEYMFIPFFAADSGIVKLSIDITGENVGTTSSAQAALLPLGGGAAVGAEPTIDWEAHLAQRARERALLNPLVRRGLTRGGGRALLQRNLAPEAALAAEPQVGDIINLQAPNFDPGNRNICQNPKQRPARIAAVTPRSILAIDVESPEVPAAELARISDEFERLVFPITEKNFGAPTDIDRNGRVIIFVTPIVNLRTPRNSQGFTAGFFFPLDLLPREIPEWNFSCPASNQAEIFYLIAPDPAGQFGDPRPTAMVTAIATGIIGHELQHLVNFGRRIYLVQGAEELEELWLDEGLAHMAQELLFYATSGLQPRQNITAPMLQNNPDALTSYRRFQRSNMISYGEYLKNPKEESLMGKDFNDDEFPTRGAAWAFLRYMADQEPGADEDFFRALVNSPVAGVRNLRRVLGENAALLWIQRWTVSSYTDDHIPEASELFMQPSWNYRSVLSNQTLTAGFFSQFPLEILPLGSSGEVALTLQGGGAAYVRLRATESRQAVITAAEKSRPSGELRISVVRIR